MSQSQIEQQPAQALREVETVREDLRRLLQPSKSEYKQTRRDNRKLREQVEQLSEEFQELAQVLSTWRRW
ncbi:hypothetical protein [Salmonella enterica]|uniref:hypothetical protein n=1 Tax=Salmonella enterica TaxID=28901 RepID=UPI001C5E24AD|nr:hypothetical protein [Salmonella enterica]